MAQDKIETYLRENDWTIAFSDDREAISPEFHRFEDLGLSNASLSSLAPFKAGIYAHQREGIRQYLRGQNLAVTTSTASGKTLIFNVCALEELSADPKARIAAIYPLKALASEQFSRWKTLVAESGLQTGVGRIDGGIPTHDRLRILQASRIVVMTPDIIHAWLFSSITSPPVLEFLRNLTLIVVDEAHTYTGVFGSNSAFLFRRIRHSVKKLGGDARFIASSATMHDPQAHLGKLIGQEFHVVGPETDTSPRAALRTILATPPKSRDVLTSVSQLVVYAAGKTDHQSITFVDSRKQTEYLASIVERHVNDVADEAEEIDFKRLQDLQVYPYRSGYEEDDRQRIQRRLADGKLRGVVSTSALEMGIDLPYLSLGVLFGIPRSATSLYQRVGRVARRKAGVIVIVNNGSVVSEAVFREPERVKSLPLVQSALYLHNPRIQYIHAMCLGRQGGEDESIGKSLGVREEKFASPIDLPTDFTALCEAERVGEISSELQPMKAQAGDDPHHTFPLRDLDVQFKVEYRQGPDLNRLGSLSYSQLMREAYPGAVYYYQTRPYRVVRIRKHERVVEVRQERRYFTSPILLPTLILPNLTANNIYQSRRYGDLHVMECAMQIGEAVVGYKERRGSNEFSVQYPLNPTFAMFHDAPKFTRYAFTSGVVFTHPGLSRENVRCATLAEIIDEAFLMSLPFERQDISAGADRHRATRDAVSEGQRFVCIYDQTYGSLRLTSHLMKTEVLRDVVARSCEIALNDPNFALNAETLTTLREMAECITHEPEQIGGTQVANMPTERFVEVILPGSVGIDVYRDNEEFEVEGVFFSPQIGGLAYRGKHLTEKRRAERETPRYSKTTIAVAVDHIRALAGESKVGYYDVETGEILDRLPLLGEF